MYKRQDLIGDGPKCLIRDKYASNNKNSHKSFAKRKGNKNNDMGNKSNKFQENNKKTQSRNSKLSKSPKSKGLDSSRSKNKRCV